MIRRAIERRLLRRVYGRRLRKDVVYDVEEAARCAAADGVDIEDLVAEVIEARAELVRRWHG